MRLEQLKDTKGLRLWIQDAEWLLSGEVWTLVTEWRPRCLNTQSGGVYCVQRGDEEAQASKGRKGGREKKNKTQKKKGSQQKLNFLLYNIFIKAWNPHCYIFFFQLFPSGVAAADLPPLSPPSSAFSSHTIQIPALSNGIRVLLAGRCPLWIGPHRLSLPSLALPPKHLACAVPLMNSSLILSILATPRGEAQHPSSLPPPALPPVFSSVPPSQNQTAPLLDPPPRTLFLNSCGCFPPLVPTRVYLLLHLISNHLHCSGLLTWNTFLEFTPWNLTVPLAEVVHLGPSHSLTCNLSSDASSPGHTSTTTTNHHQHLLTTHRPGRFKSGFICSDDAGF